MILYDIKLFILLYNIFHDFTIPFCKYFQIIFPIFAFISGGNLCLDNFSGTLHLGARLLLIVIQFHFGVTRGYPTAFAKWGIFCC